MILEDKELRKIILFKLGNLSNEDISDNQLKEIEALNINNRNLAGEDLKINLNEIALCTNLKKLSLQYFMVNDKIINLLNMLPKLNTIELSSCKLFSKKELRNNSLQNILINCCDISDYTKIASTNILRIIGQDDIDLKKIRGKENIEKMYLQASRIKNFEDILNFENLKILNLDGSNVDDIEVLEKIKEKIYVSHLEQYMPIK